MDNRIEKITKKEHFFLQRGDGEFVLTRIVLNNHVIRWFIRPVAETLGDQSMIPGEYEALYQNKKLM